MPGDLSEFLRQENLRKQREEKEMADLEARVVSETRSSALHIKELLNVLAAKHNNRIAVDFGESTVNPVRPTLEVSSNVFDTWIFYCLAASYNLQPLQITWDHAAQRHYHVSSSSNHGDTSYLNYEILTRKRFIANPSGFHTVVEQKYVKYRNQALYSDTEWSYALVARHGDTSRFLPIFEQKVLAEIERLRRPNNLHDPNYWV